MPTEFDRARFRDLIQYICFRCADPRKLGSIKLNKILWFSDVTYFIRNGISLTGETYVKQTFGPVPRHGPAVVRELADERLLIVREPECDGEPRQFIATAKPALNDHFTAEQISMVDLFIDQICNSHTARSISQATHDEVWELAETGEEIPYEAYMALRGRDAATDADLRWAREELAGADAR